MQKFIDYYKILQIHYLADQDVVESTYKKLAKKYHPDLNKSKNAQTLMQKINSAYEVLGDVNKRPKYHLIWEQRVLKNNTSEQENRNPDYKCLYIINSYFNNILEGKYKEAYELISNYDKKHISKEDFIIWQHMVSIVYQLKKHGVRMSKCRQNKFLDGVLFKEVVEFNVDVLEYNMIMDMVEQNLIKKSVVYEDGKWAIYLGYKDLQVFIEKFKSLTNLLDAKQVVAELSESHSKIDRRTGLVNKKGIVEKLESEILRHNRYGNVFSLIILEVKHIREKKQNEEQKDNTIIQIANLLVDNLRQLDIVARWSETIFLIMLPETDLRAAKKVVNKLIILINERKTHGGKNTFEIESRVAASESKDSLQVILERLNS